MSRSISTPARGMTLSIAASILTTVMACGGNPPTGPASAGGASAGPGASVVAADPALVARYGYGPQPDPAIVYQPDVVLIGGGPAAIRSVSADGLIWSMDASAPGVADLATGKIMFASSDAVGRVLRIEPRGDAVDVTLGPVGLGEIVSDARIALDQSVSLEDLAFNEIAQIPDGYEDFLSDELTSGRVDGGDVLLTAPTIVLAAARPPGGSTQIHTLADAQEKSTKLGDWTLTGYRTEGALGLRAERGIGSAGKPVSGADLKIAIDAHIEVSNLRVVADIPVTRGEVGDGHFRVYGITGLVISAQGGAVNGLSDNRKVRIEIPIELRQPVIIGGFPAMLTQKFKFLVNTAFSAKNGNITAKGEWDVDGSIGMDGQTVTLPTMTARGVSLIDSLAGVSIGLNAIVVAVSFEFGLVVGMPVAGAGPVASFITSLGLTNGSSLGIVQCKQVSITSVVNAGVALQVFDPIKKALKALVGYDVPAQKQLLTKNVLEERWVKPDVAACR